LTGDDLAVGARNRNEFKLRNFSGLRLDREIGGG
jgi:hypothetical protein